MNVKARKNERHAMWVIQDAGISKNAAIDRKQQRRIFVIVKNAAILTVTTVKRLVMPFVHCWLLLIKLQ